jgi:hypothetical protein
LHERFPSHGKRDDVVTLLTSQPNSIFTNDLSKPTHTFLHYLPSLLSLWPGTVIGQQAMLSVNPHNLSAAHYSI